MTLQYQVENLDGMDEATAQLYLEKDGKFVLDIDGVDAHVKNEDKDKIPLSRLNQEIEKRKASDSALTELAEELKKDVPEDKAHLIPELSPLKLVKWLRKASAEGLFESKPAESIDTKRPGDKKPANLDNLHPVELIKMGLKKK